MTRTSPGHIRLTSHSSGGKPHAFPLNWGASTASERGPVIGSIAAGSNRNVIGAHGGAYSIYRALAVSSGTLNAGVKPDLTNTNPVIDIGPHPQWTGREKIVSLDPWGHRITEDFREQIASGQDCR